MVKMSLSKSVEKSSTIFISTLSSSVSSDLHVFQGWFGRILIGCIGCFQQQEIFKILIIFMPSRIFSIFCSQCDSFIFRYRKDGSGSLIRVYINQISEPEHFKEYKKAMAKSKIPPLICTQCGQRIGAPMIYESGNRLAYRLIKGSFKKKQTWSSF